MPWTVLDHLPVEVKEVLNIHNISGSGCNLCSPFHDLLIKCSQSESLLHDNNSHNIFYAVIFLLQFTQSWGLLCFHSPPSPLPSHNGFEGGPAPPQSTSLESRSSSRRLVWFIIISVILLSTSYYFHHYSYIVCAAVISYLDPLTFIFAPVVSAACQTGVSWTRSTASLLTMQLGWLARPLSQ